MLTLPAMSTRWSATARGLRRRGAPVGLRRLRGDDGARNGVAKMMVTTLGTGVARVGVEVRPEKFRRRRDPKLVVAGDLLRERRGERLRGRAWTRAYSLT